MMRPMLATAVVCVCITQTSLAQVKIVHNPTYTEGETATIEVETNSNQVLTISGMNLETKVEQFLIMKRITGKQKDDGTWPLTTHFDNMQVNMNLLGGIELKFDSGNPDKKSDIPQLEQILKLFRAITKSKWTTMVNADHKVKSIAYEGNPLEGLDENLKKEADIGKFRKAAEIELARMPDGPVTKGDTWKRTEEAKIGGGQTFTYEKEYKYLGTETIDGRIFHKIGAKVLTVKYAMDENAASPLKVIGSELKIAASKGTLFFDRELKLITKTSEQVTIKGDMKFSINGMELPGKFDLTIKTGSKIAGE
jgi:hypothetical protein